MVCDEPVWLAMLNGLIVHLDHDITPQISGVLVCTIFADQNGPIAKLCLVVLAGCGGVSWVTIKGFRGT